MPLPLFGFSSQQIQARPVLRNRPPSGFFDQLSDAFTRTFDVSQRQEGELKLQRERQDFARQESLKANQLRAFENKQKRQADIDAEVAAGTRVLATQDNLSFLRRVLPEDSLDNAVITLSDGTQVINNALWARAQQLNDQTIETVPIDTESFSSIAGELERFGIKINAETIADPDGNNFTSEARMNQLMTTLQTASSVAGIVQRERDSVRDSLARAATGSNTKAQEDFTEAVNAAVARDVAGLQIFRKDTGEEITGRDKRLLLHKMHSEDLNPFESGDIALLGAIDDNFDFLPMPTATEAIEAAADVVNDAISSTDNAKDFLNSIAQPVINGLGADVVRQRLGANNRDNSDVVFSSLIMGNETFTKAMLLMNRFQNAEQLEQYFLELGGYQGFRAFYDGSVVRLIKDLDPENFGSLDVGSVSLGVARPQSDLDAPGEAADSAFVVPNPSGAGVLGQAGISAAEGKLMLSNDLTEAFTLSLKREPQAARQIDELIRAVNDPTIGEDILLQELEDIRRLINTPGLYTPEQIAAQNASVDLAIEFIKENSGILPQTLGPILTDALKKAEESLEQ